MAENRYELNKQLAQMLKGGVIMDVTTPEQAKIAEAEESCVIIGRCICQKHTYQPSPAATALDAKIDHRERRNQHTGHRQIMKPGHMEIGISMRNAPEQQRNIAHIDRLDRETACR